MHRENEICLAIIICSSVLKYYTFVPTSISIFAPLILVYILFKKYYKYELFNKLLITSSQSKDPLDNKLKLCFFSVINRSNRYIRDFEMKGYNKNILLLFNIYGAYALLTSFWSLDSHYSLIKTV